jgi:TonB family protein
MKHISKSAVMFSVSLLLSSLALSAKTVEQTYIETYQGRTDTPVPISVVTPDAPVRASDGTVVVELAFVIDEKGNPQQITVRSSDDLSVSEPVKEAVAQWKFAPIMRNGVAVSSKVILPVRLVAAD